MTKFSHLPDGEKKRLCLDLLREFNAKNIRESGDELIHSCPLPFGMHRNGDSNPSASLNWQKLVFNCLGCGGKGSLLWFISVMRGESTEDARGWLSAQTGVNGVQEIGALMQFLDSLNESPEDNDHSVMPRYNSRILEPWLVDHPYFSFRRLPEQNVKDSKIGFDGSSIIIPHFWNEELVGWQARRLVKDQGPKYKSTPEFPRDRTLYNYNRHSDTVVVVESPMSVISKRHLFHLEATFGAAVTTKQCSLIANHRGRIILFFDNDEAGWKATTTVGDWLCQRQSNVFAVDNPYAADPADMSDEMFSRLVSNNVVPYVLWSRPSSLKEMDDGFHQVQSWESS